MELGVDNDRARVPHCRRSTHTHTERERIPVKRLCVDNAVRVDGGVEERALKQRIDEPNDLLQVGRLLECGIHLDIKFRAKIRIDQPTLTMGERR